MINNLTIEGRLTSKAEEKGKEKKVIVFRLAYNYGWNKEEKKPFTAFIDCLMAANDGLLERLDKGTRVILVGSLSSTSYTNKQGEKVEKETILVNTLEIIFENKVEK